ncbi:MAG: hypothetical protein KatS3mg126_1756 [Lysobacteraceae bacterium]|nr:MAG: hypothetical protein KatS3mg126_1756 [Xanthomonadaceae bacterium]
MSHPTPATPPSELPLGLLRLPLAEALVVLGMDGRWLDGNAEGRRWHAELSAGALKARLDLALAQLRASPERCIQWRADTPAGPLECHLVALSESGRAAVLSLVPAQAAEQGRGRDRAVRELAGEDVFDWLIPEQRVLCSPRWARRLGLPPGVTELTSTEYAERLHPEDLPAAYEAMLENLRARREEFRAEYRLRLADGRYMWVLNRGRVIARSPEGRAVRMIGTHVDITHLKRLEAHLRDRELLLREAERVGDVGAWAWDPAQQQLWCSDGLRRMLRLRHGDPANLDALAALFEGEAAQRFRRALIRLRVGGEPFELELARGEGAESRRHLLLRGEALRDANGHIERLLGVVQDITERVLREESERIRNEMLDRVAQVGRIGGWEYEIETGTLRWTEENYRIHGIAPGTPVSIASTRPGYLGSSGELFDRAVARMVRGERDEDTIEVQYVTPQEERLWLRITGRLERREGRPFRITGMTRDITAEREASERIEQLAHFDTLTGLPNRFRFRELAVRAIEQARREGSGAALLFLDLDRFKYVNDTFGHEAGDQLLLDVAGRIRAAVRSCDIVARQSGDEFLVLLRELGRAEDAAQVARKIIDAVARPVQVGEAEVQVGVSIGIALLADDLPTLEQLLRAADTAMYAAKDSGRNRFQFYSDAFYSRVQRRLQLEQDLRKALPGKELSLAFQPTLDLADGRIRGIETLLRWKGPDGEARPPAEFIPVAEECGEILPIGLWVLEQACRQAREWLSGGLRFERIAVNVSAIQLRDPEFARAVLDICERCHLPPGRLELELTESALMRDSEVLRRSFALFEAHGVSLSVDDFGTGFSNLHYLHRFPVRHIKIDRSFVLGLMKHSQMDRLVEAIIGMGHALGLRVVAEGVETQATAERLRGIGCDEAQGYLYTPPLPPRLFEQWARETGRF